MSVRNWAFRAVENNNSRPRAGRCLSRIAEVFAAKQRKIINNKVMRNNRFSQDIIIIDLKL
jgi:hypothetical protein